MSFQAVGNFGGSLVSIGTKEKKNIKNIAKSGERIGRENNLSIYCSKGESKG